MSRTDSPHGLVLGVMDDHGVKTCINTLNHCAPHKQYIIRSFKQYIKLINIIIDFLGKSRDWEIYCTKMIKDPERETLVTTRGQTNTNYVQ